MRTITLRSKEWKQIRPYLEKHPNVYVGDPKQCRRFIEGVLWINRTGAQWRMLPKAYGKWNSIYKRFARWYEKEIWAQLHRHTCITFQHRARPFAAIVAFSDPDQRSPPSHNVCGHPDRHVVFERYSSEIPLLILTAEASRLAEIGHSGL